MDKQQKQYVALGVLLLVFFIILFGTLKPKKKKVVPPLSKTAGIQTLNIPKPNPVSSSGPQQSIMSLATAKDLEAQKKNAEAAWGLDPFYHTGKSTVYQSSTLVLKGVSIGQEKQGYAFINDDIVTVDDIVSGYKVLEVQKNKVLLGRGGERFYLVLPQE